MNVIHKALLSSRHVYTRPTHSEHADLGADAKPASMNGADGKTLADSHLCGSVRCTPRRGYPIHLHCSRDHGAGASRDGQVYRRPEKRPCLNTVHGQPE
ncbi:hypothetical protein K523DRAFT_91407 [Schizophyllum commune Tattone D]|nr:hypothetical protein K523DRAFT_91407 [Schizophyllum commune Tattone D]